MSILGYLGLTVIYIVTCIGVSALCVGISDIKDRVNEKRRLKELNSVNTSFIINGINYTWDDTKRVFQAQTPSELEESDDELNANYFEQRY